MQLLVAKKKSSYTNEDTSLDVRNYIVKDDENNDHSLTFTIIDKTQPHPTTTDKNLQILYTSSNFFSRSLREDLAWINFSFQLSYVSGLKSRYARQRVRNPADPNCSK